MASADPVRQYFRVPDYTGVANLQAAKSGPRITAGCQQLVQKRLSRLCADERSNPTCYMRDFGS